ncbi:GTPase, G3E family [Methylobacterium sp. 174MFSha1.1]|uniref:CobW family GTP-binding protein n=1 Tax=Methylobacterium sp. 174MFSha1.1 TaxID=1502749 RepID=UPI0008F39F6F|nr:GTP-binding protein [Methylobacterium sp. 174MFSha1.1]SFU47562.1 GTPase, G3E family [Methylobacterium sp. 174MFSha1.1]
MADPGFTPVILLTGFLGSGKSTLLSRLLADPALGDTAVLINEFGEVGLDHHLLDRIDEEMVLLSSGCVCCTIRGELAAAIRTLQSRRARGEVPPFRRVVVESTGLADPLPVIATITADPVLRHHFRMGAVVTTVDAVNGPDQLARQPESVAQAAVADRLVLTKTDLATPAQVAATIAALRALNPDAPLLRAAGATLDAAALLSGRQALTTVAESFRCVPAPAGAGNHAADVSTFALVFEASIDWTRFGLWLTMLLHSHGSAILRVKGLLNVAGADTPVAIHGVQQLVHVPTHLSAWPDPADRRSRLVFIIRGLDAGLIERSLRAFGLMPAGASEGVEQGR